MGRGAGAHSAPFRAGPGLLNRLGAVLGNVTGWRAIIHSLLRLPAAVVACAAAAGLWGGGLLLLGCPLWRQFSALAHLSPPGWPVAALVSAAGLALLLLAPWGVHLALAPERMLPVRCSGPRRATPGSAGWSRHGRWPQRTRSPGSARSSGTCTTGRRHGW